MAAALLTCVASTSASAAPPRRPTGALFASDYRGGAHYCSASVVHSAHHNLVATAAHCVTGTGVGLQFVPDYDGGAAPRGAWRVTAVYVDSAWLRTQNPRYDIAILRVVSSAGADLENAVGALRIGFAPARGAVVRVRGYTAGAYDSELRCATRVYRAAGYPAVDCTGFGDGTSGGAWILGRRLVGLTGGLHQGGCAADTSYSPPFGWAVRSLVHRAELGGRGDALPPPPSDGC